MYVCMRARVCVCVVFLRVRIQTYYEMKTEWSKSTRVWGVVVAG